MSKRIPVLVIDGDEIVSKSLKRSLELQIMSPKKHCYTSTS